MARKPPAVLIRQGNWGSPAEFGARLLAEARREFGFTIVVKGHQRAVEGGVPQG